MTAKKNAVVTPEMEETQEEATATEEKVVTASVESPPWTEMEEVTPQEQEQEQAASKAVAVQETNASSEAVQEALRAAGQEGLELGYGSFQTIKLDSDEFVSSDDITLGQWFDCYVFKSKGVIAYAQKVEGDGGEFFYTYNDKETTGGDPIDAILQEWDADEIPYKRVERMEVTAKVVASAETDEMDEEIVMLNLPPTGKKRYSGFVTGLALNQKKINETLVRVQVGAKVKRGSNTFRPWIFKISPDN